MKSLYRLLTCLPVLLLASCAATQAPVCAEGAARVGGCPSSSDVDDAQINELYENRTWRKQADLPTDSVTFGEEAKIPIEHARVKLFGPTHDDSISSLAAKIWLIEHAQHTIDATYYIFTPDLIGHSILAAMCDAVKRGVDVRVMADSLGSLNLVHEDLKAMGSCSAQAGFMRNAQGQVTTKRARAQVLIFNSIEKMHVNRRSHDKLLVVDGHFPEAAVFTGGRNVSLDYYGLKEDGTTDPMAFRDTEILVRPPLGSEVGRNTVGTVGEIYYSLLFLYKGNNVLWGPDDQLKDSSTFASKRREAADGLAFLKAQPDFRAKMDTMDRFMTEGYRDARVRLAHQLNNLVSKRVSTDVKENLERNPNSIDYLLHKALTAAHAQGDVDGTLRIVSPYLFAAKYYDKDGKLVHDSAQDLLDVLAKNPHMKVEIVTNSAMTSDNPFTQAIIDLDMAPRLLLTPEMQKQWLSGLEEGERNPAVVQSDDWQRLVLNPQIEIYEMGKLDSSLLGKGTANYGKLHAKFIVGETEAFVGTSNFDYRSMLYNNELGFFIADSALLDDLVADFNWLKDQSYRWGSPEWLEMRKQLMAGKDAKAGYARKQRIIFKSVRDLHLEYLM
jgi:cardiolipin synthase C